MRRRTFLAGVATALAGCGAESDEPTSTPTPSASPTRKSSPDGVDVVQRYVDLAQQHPAHPRIDGVRLDKGELFVVHDTNADNFDQCVVEIGVVVSVYRRLLEEGYDLKAVYGVIEFGSDFLTYWILRGWVENNDSDRIVANLAAEDSNRCYAQA